MSRAASWRIGLALSALAGGACAQPGEVIPFPKMIPLPKAGLAVLPPDPVLPTPDGTPTAQASPPGGCMPPKMFRTTIRNDDPLPPEGLPGEAVELWTHGALVFRHEARAGAAGEVCGHHHPKAAVATRAGRVSRPCFVADARRIMLPALGAYAGGLDVRNPAIAGLFPRGGRAFLLGEDRLFSFALGQVAA